MGSMNVLVQPAHWQVSSWAGVISGDDFMFDSSILETVNKNQESK